MAKEKESAKAKENAKAKTRKAPKAREQQATSPQLDVLLNMNRDFERMFSKGVREAAPMVRDTVQSLVQIDEELKRKETRIQKRTRKKLAKAIEKAVSNAALKSPSFSGIRISTFVLDEKGNRISTGESPLPLRNGVADRLASSYSAIVEMLKDESKPLASFKKLSNPLKGQLGAGLDDEHFLSGSFSLELNHDKPEDSKAEYQFEVFAKKGSRKGAHLKFSVRHDLGGKKADGTMEFSLPVKKAAAAETKTDASSTKK